MSEEIAWGPPPTPEEARAHAETHGRVWWPEAEEPQPPEGLWLWKDVGDAIRVGPVGLDHNDNPRMWVFDLGYYIQCDGGEFLPLNDNGFPVARVKP